ncbi:MAG: GNAT family protein [Dehalococcoidales bacterium]|nr:GNAT family protein [Dehalococcoidales bacterium]
MQPISYEKYYWQNELVRLRAISLEDWEADFPNYFDSPARFWLEEETELPPVIANVQEAYKKFANFNPVSGRLMFTVETLDGTAVGGLNLNSINERNGTFSIGIQIGVGNRGKGYGVAAMRILLRYAFLERRLNKFNSGCIEGNLPSAAMHKKVGCIQEGTRRQMYFSSGRFFDWVLFGMTKDEFVENELTIFKQ